MFLFVDNNEGVLFIKTTSGTGRFYYYVITDGVISEISTSRLYVSIRQLFVDLHMTDTLYKQLSIVLQTLQSATDVVTTLRKYFRNMLDASGVSDVLQTTKQYVRNLKVTTYMVDLTSRVIEGYRKVETTYSVTDRVGNLRFIRRLLEFLANTSDVITHRYGFIRKLVDSITTTATFIAKVTYLRKRFEDLVVSSAVYPKGLYNKLVTEIVNSTSRLSRWITRMFKVMDEVGVTSNVRKFINIVLQIVMTVQDTALIFGRFVRLQVETLRVYSILKRAMQSFRELYSQLNSYTAVLKRFVGDSFGKSRIILGNLIPTLKSVFAKSIEPPKIQQDSEITDSTIVQNSDILKVDIGKIESVKPGMVSVDMIEDTPQIIRTDDVDVSKVTGTVTDSDAEIIADVSVESTIVEADSDKDSEVTEVIRPEPPEIAGK